MARDSNGNYSLPPGYKATSGETILASQHNPPLEDLASAMTGSLPRDGSAPMGGPLRTVTGSAGSPAISPNGNPTVGIYFTSTGVAFAGTVSGARFIGELIPWTMLTAPALTVFPDGRTLLRASYPDLWSKAQTEIAAGNQFYNNGDGSTTFGIGDVRGRTISGTDNMGGSDANRNPSVHAQAIKLGGTAGSDTHTLTQAQLPAVSPTFTGITDTVTVTTVRSDLVFGTVAVDQGGSGGAIGCLLPSTRENNSASSIGSFKPSGTISALGSGTAHNNLQNTMFLQFVLYAGA